VDSGAVVEFDAEEEGPRENGRRFREGVRGGGWGVDVRRKFVEDDMLGRGGVYPAEMSMIWDGGCRWNGRWRFSFPR